MRKYNYGITREQQEAELARVNGKCEACGVASLKLQFDHDHATGRLRGILCRSCNISEGFLAIGFLKNPELIAKITAYLVARKPKAD